MHTFEHRLSRTKVEQNSCRFKEGSRQLKSCPATLTRPTMSQGWRVRGVVRAHKRSAEPRPLDVRPGGATPL